MSERSSPSSLPLIEVPFVDTFPDTPPRRPDTAGSAAYLLTQLLRHDSGTLYAEVRSDGGRWHVQGWTRETLGPDDVVAVTEPLAVFRMVLAHFGTHYMGGQVYGGYSERRLSQQGRTHGVAFYMGNDAWRGYWLKAYSVTAIFSAPEGGGPAAHK